MSRKPDDGGPASHGPVGYHPGMSLRDYFAGQALAALLTHKEAFDDLGETTVAQMAYDQADAMLAVRQMPAESVAEAQQVAAGMFNQTESIGAK